MTTCSDNGSTSASARTAALYKPWPKPILFVGFKGATRGGAKGAEALPLAKLI